MLYDSEGVTTLDTKIESFYQFNYLIFSKLPRIAGLYIEKTAQ